MPGSGTIHGLIGKGGIKDFLKVVGSKNAGLFEKGDKYPQQTMTCVDLQKDQ